MKLKYRFGRGSEQTLDRQPAQHLCLEALPETGLGLGGVAHFLVTLARYPYEAIAVEFHPIRVRGRDRVRCSRADASPALDN